MCLKPSNRLGPDWLYPVRSGFEIEDQVKIRVQERQDVIIKLIVYRINFCHLSIKFLIILFEDSSKIESKN